MAEKNTMTVETREVLAGAYVTAAVRSMLTHAVLVDRHGRDAAVMCRRVKFDNLADRGASDPAAPVTCKACLSALRKAEVQRPAKETPEPGR